MQYPCKKILMMDIAGGGYMQRGLTGGNRFACKRPGCIRLRNNTLEYQQILGLAVVRVLPIKIYREMRLKVKAGKATTKYPILE